MTVVQHVFRIADAARLAALRFWKGGFHIHVLALVFASPGPGGAKH